MGGKRAGDTTSGITVKDVLCDLQAEGMERANIKDLTRQRLAEYHADFKLVIFGVLSVAENNASPKE
jgi:hypothetical protein